MGFTKWLTGLLGWVVLGPIGGLLGFLYGMALERGEVPNWSKAEK